MKNYFPIAQWLPEYSTAFAKGDITAGLTVGIMLIPQGMAYALLAGMPPIYGLYAAIIPQIVYVFMGTCRQMAVGPVALDSLLVAAGVGLLAQGGSADYISLAILLAFMVGVIQLGLGVAKLGFLVNFLSRPVISGFTSAAAIIIFVSQLGHLFHIKLPRDASVFGQLAEVVQSAADWHMPTLAVGLGAAALIIFLKKIKSKVPGTLVAVVAGIAAVYGLGLAGQGVEIVGEVPGGLPAFSLPNFSVERLQQLFPTALTIALVGFMEATSVAKAMEAKDPANKVVANQELRAIGLGNIFGSFFNAFPTTAGLARSAVNQQAGARTNIAALISAAIVSLTLLFFTDWFYYLPNTVLAAIILVAIVGLVNVKEPQYLWKADRRDFFMLMATFVATLFLGIIQGIAVGVVLSMGMVIYRAAYPHMAVLGQMPNSRYYRNIHRFPEAIQRPDVLIVRFDAQLFFANSAFFENHMQTLEQAKGEALRLVVISASSIPAIDSTAAHTFTKMLEDYQKRGIRMAIAGAIGPVRDMLFRSGLIDRLGKENLFMHVQDAIAHHDGQLSELSESRAALQTNT